MMTVLADACTNASAMACTLLAGVPYGSRVGLPTDLAYASACSRDSDDSIFCRALKSLGGRDEWIDIVVYWLNDLELGHGRFDSFGQVRHASCVIRC